MHIPDGQLDPVTLGLAAAASGAAVVVAARSLRAGHKRIGLALMGGAGVMIAHLADVPLYGTFTGHLIGGTLLAIAVGPTLALLAMALVLAAEAVLLGDGGVMALGANVLTMGVAGVFVGYGVYRGLLAVMSRLHDVLARVIAAGVAGFVSAVASTAVLVGLYAMGADSIRGEAGEGLPDLLGHYAAWAGLEGVTTAAIVAVAVLWRRLVRRGDRVSAEVPEIETPVLTTSGWPLR